MQGLVPQILATIPGQGFCDLLELKQYSVNGFRIISVWIHLNGLATIFNPNAFREAKIVYIFGLSECNKVKRETTVTEQ